MCRVLRFRIENIHTFSIHSHGQHGKYWAKPYTPPAPRINAKPVHCLLLETKKKKNSTFKSLNSVYMKANALKMYKRVVYEYWIWNIRRGMMNAAWEFLQVCKSHTFIRGISDEHTSMIYPYFVQNLSLFFILFRFPHTLNPGLLWFHTIIHHTGSTC